MKPTKSWISASVAVLASLYMASGAFASGSSAEEHPQWYKVQTSNASINATVGKFENDCTLIIDSAGNRTTLGELKAAANFQFSEALPPLDLARIFTDMTRPENSFAAHVVAASDNFRFLLK